MSLTRRVFLERIAQIGGSSAAFRTMQVLGLTPTASASSLPALTADFGRGKSVVEPKPFAVVETKLLLVGLRGENGRPPWTFGFEETKPHL